MQYPDLSPILSLPVRTDESWEGGVTKITDLLGLPSQLSENGREMMLVLWRSSTTDFVHARPFTLPPGDQDGLLDTFLTSLIEFQHTHEFSHQPATIQCGNEELAIGLRRALGEAGPTVEYAPEMDGWNAVLAGLADQLRSDFATAEPLPWMFDAGYSEDQLRAFAQAAANFYRAKLWDQLDDIDLIEFATPRPPKDMRFAVVLGAGDQIYGLGFYADAEAHYDMRARRADPRELSLMSLTFDSIAETNSDDARFWQELDLPLETADAFPSLHGFTASGLRRATSKQLEFATIVLQALAETTEEEIDRGAWTKTVKVNGRNRRFKCSIPNLLEPPDRAEWMRRGLMPDQREHERHFQMIQDFIDEHEELSIEELNDILNTKFTGPMDKIEYSLDTPADRAAAKCQEAMECFGRRRVQLARQALEEDPNHAESLVLLAESIRDPERGVEAFQHATAVAREQLGTMLQEAVGHFWEILETRPFLRACHGLANALKDTGQSNEAIAQYLEILRLNPEDNLGVRYEVIPLMIAQNQESAASQLLEEYHEDSAPVVLHEFAGRIPQRRSKIHECTTGHAGGVRGQRICSAGTSGCRSASLA